MTLYTEGKDNGDAKADDENQELPKLAKGEELNLLGLVPKQHFTEPPPRYNQSTLVKTLEEKGIGRPSTYASIISTIQDRQYVLLEDRKFKPTELGFTVTDLLVKHFPDVMDVQFTAGMETKLDDIEDGDLDWVKVMSDFWGPFQESLASAKEHMESVKKPPRETDEKCPKCGKPLVIRESKYGPFLSCSGYPKCKTIVSKGLGEPCPMPGCGGTMVEAGARKYKCSNAPTCAYTSRANGEENGEGASGAVTDQVCPKCGKPLVIREGKYGPFLSCSGYPKCKTIVSKGLGELCPMPGCGGTMVDAGARKLKCSNAPECAYTSRVNGESTEENGGAPSGEATDQVCPNCGKPLVKRKGRFGEFLGCSGYPKCKTIVNLQKQDGAEGAPAEASAPEEIMPCPADGCSGTIVRKKSRYGDFYACNRYPKCKYSLPGKPLDRKCPQCGSLLAEKQYKGRPQGVVCISETCDYKESAQSEDRAEALVSG
jgi:DNA topoisomerase-1